MLDETNIEECRGMKDETEIRVSSSNACEDFLEAHLSGQWGVIKQICIIAIFLPYLLFLENFFRMSSGYILYFLFYLFILSYIDLFEGISFTSRSGRLVIENERSRQSERSCPWVRSKCYFNPICIIPKIFSRMNSSIIIDRSD
jgi:hypothetical protein